MTKSNRKAIIEELARTYKQTGQLFYKCIHSALAHNQSYNQASMPILKVLKQNGAMSQHEIAQELHHTDASISRQIKLLHKKGHVSVKSNPTNRRLAVITLTPAGKKALAAIEQVVLTYLEQMLENVPDKKLQQVIQINTELQKLINPLKE